MYLLTNCYTALHSGGPKPTDAPTPELTEAPIPELTTQSPGIYFGISDTIDKSRYIFCQKSRI